jgi:hypothetical protein
MANQLLRKNMENIAYSCLRTSLAKIRKVGLTCLAASSLTTTAVAQAQPHSPSKSAVPVLTERTGSGEPGWGSPTVEAGEACTTRNRYDELCPWGRLSDGRGSLVRCLTVDEAQALAKSANGETATGGAAAMVPSDEQPAIEAIVNSVVFEGEHIASAKQNLASVVSDYQSCVALHGGLRYETGEVRIRFHVDSRGIARDASVSWRRVVSIRAARCIVGIVEHRFVGVPKTKASIGTLVIHFTRGARSYCCR